MEVDREKLSERLLSLKQREQEAFASLWALRGAVSELELLLGEREEEIEEEEVDGED